MRLYSKEWILWALKELGGEANADLLRLMSAGAYPSKAAVEDCYVPQISEDGVMSCIEGALEELAQDGVIELKDGKVKLLNFERALRSKDGVLQRDGSVEEKL